MLVFHLFLHISGGMLEAFGHYDKISPSQIFITVLLIVLNLFVISLLCDTILQSGFLNASCGIHLSAQ